MLAVRGGFAGADRADRDRALDRGRQFPALRHGRVPGHGGREDRRPRSGLRAPGALDGGRQARTEELLGRAPGIVPEGRQRWSRRSSYPVVGRARSTSTRRSPYAFLRSVRARRLRAQARPHGAGRQAGRRGETVDLSVPEVGNRVHGRTSRRASPRRSRRPRRSSSPTRPGPRPTAPGEAEAEDPAAGRARRRSASCGSRRRSSLRSRRSSSTSRTSSSSRARGRPTPSRSTSAKCRASRRSARSATTSPGKLIDEDAWAINQGSARARRQDPAAARSRGRQGPHQGGRAVDRGRRREVRSSSSSTTRSSRPGRTTGPTSHDPDDGSTRAATTCARRPSPRTARKPTTSGC